MIYGRYIHHRIDHHVETAMRWIRGGRALEKMPGYTDPRSRLEGDLGMHRERKGRLLSGY